jgi:hypothetical protein
MAHGNRASSDGLQPSQIGSRAKGKRADAAAANRRATDAHEPLEEAKRDFRTIAGHYLALAQAEEILARTKSLLKQTAAD